LGWNPKANSNQITEYYENIKNNPSFATEDGEVIITLEILKAHFKNLSKEFLLEHSHANRKSANAGADNNYETITARISPSESYADTKPKASEIET
jgi:hypothetical protein